MIEQETAKKQTLRNDILKALDKDSKLTIQDLADMLAVEPEIIRTEIQEMEEEKVICGYPTLIDWDKTTIEKVTALIEVKVAPRRGVGFDYMADRIYKFEEVQYVYLMSADYGLMVIVEGRTMKEVASFVSSKLAPMESVLSTATHFVLKKYKEHGIPMVEDEKDERMLITP